MLSTLIEKAQGNSEEDMLTIIERFKPLMIKYANKLNYEDAYSDIVLHFINLIKSIRLSNLTDKTDKVIISYINKSIINFYNKKIPRIISRQKEILMSELTEEQKYHIEIRVANNDETDIINEYGLECLLNNSERQLIYKVYVEGHTIAELAKHQKRTRQAVNQQRIRAINKIKKCLQN